MSGNFEDKHTRSHYHNREKNLLGASLLNTLITVVEVIGGIISNSISLISDAVHNLGDTLAVLIAYIASRIGRKDATEKKTFGYKRIEILSALLNAVVLVVITIFLFIEAFRRLLSPEPIKGLIMFSVALVGLIANLAAVLLLKGNSSKNLNIRAAYLHMLSDTVSSVAVIIGSGLIYFFHIYWIDPVITFLIGLYVLKEAFIVLKETIDILMQSTPSNIDLRKVVAEIEKNGEINNVHHVHAWKLDDTHIHFECHADLDKDLPLSQADIIRMEIEKMLLNKFTISHVTIQFEYNCCDEKSIIHR
jgi:cobalt-zinc-cadmium efflux system protein